MPVLNIKKNRIGKVISLLFFFSGVTGLIYEVLWAKYLSLFLGNTAQANTIVLATFMGGLALGNYLLGIWADRAKNHLRLYGWLELGIGILGAISPLLLSLLSNVYISLAKGNQLDPLLLIIFRFSLSICIILIPTILMGGTLPILSRFATHSLNLVRSTVSWFYFVNSAGAVLGALLAGFFLISSFGLDLSITIAAVINVIIGIISLALGRRMEKKDLPDFTAEKTVRKNLAPDYLRIRVIYGAVLLSGLVAMTYEIAWIRLLSLVLGSSTYSFSLMLAAFIAGIAFGSLIVSRQILPDINSYLLFGLAELGIFLAIIFTLPVYERLPYYFSMFSGALNRDPANFYLYETCKFLFCFFLMILPTTFIGMTLPLACQVVIQNINRVGENVGKIFSINIAGNVLGAVLAGLALLPLLGIKNLIEAGILVNLLIGSIVIGTTRQLRLLHKSAIIMVCFLMLFFHIFTTSSWNKIILSSGGFRNRQTLKFKNFQEYKKAFGNQSLLYYKDDNNATVTVVQKKNGEIFLKTNGKAEASSHGDLPTQLLLSHIPLSLNPDAKQVLVIGMGSGITAGSALRYPIDKLDMVEISQGVIEAAKFFNSYNYNVLKDPRLHLHIEDAKTFLQLTPHRYDVIISEPSNPWIAGIGSLFSVEFYRKASSHLAEGGVMAQWFHIYEMSDYTVRLILRTFTSVFKHVTLWNTSSMDVMLIGSNSPLLLNFSLDEERLSQKEIKKDLLRIGIENLSTLLSLQIASNETVRKIAGKGRLNEDFFPILEYEAPKNFFLGNTSKLVHFHDERSFPPEGNSLYLTSYLDGRNQPLSRDEFKNLIGFHRKYGVKRIYKSILNDWIRSYPQDYKNFQTFLRQEKINPK